MLTLDDFITDDVLNDMYIEGCDRIIKSLSKINRIKKKYIIW